MTIKFIFSRILAAICCWSATVPFARARFTSKDKGPLFRFGSYPRRWLWCLTLRKRKQCRDVVCGWKRFLLSHRVPKWITAEREIQFSAAGTVLVYEHARDTLWYWTSNDDLLLCARCCKAKEARWQWIAALLVCKKGWWVHTHTHTYTGKSRRNYMSIGKWWHLPCYCFSDYWGVSCVLERGILMPPLKLESWSVTLWKFT